MATNNGNDGDESAEWRDLGRELLDGDQGMHDAALVVLREMVGVLRARRAGAKRAAVRWTAPGKAKASA